jgi:hypothetical protein
LSSNADGVEPGLLHRAASRSIRRPELVVSVLRACCGGSVSATGARPIALGVHSQSSSSRRGT